MDYKTVYEEYKANEWVNGLFVSLRLEKKFEPLWYEEMYEVYFQTFPRRRKKPTNEQLQALPGFVSLREKYANMALEWLEKARKEQRERFSWLFEHAEEVELNGDWQKVATQSRGTYSTQTTPLKYAKADMQRHGDMLTELGIEWEIKAYWHDDDFKVFYFDEDDDIKVSKIQGFDLYAPLEDYQFFAAKMRNKQTTLEWATSCWQRGVNPKVYRPFLDDVIFEKSLVLSRST